MTVVILDPDSTIANGDSTLTGSSRHAALSDADDASFVVLTGAGALKLSTEDPALPAGAVLKSAKLQIRADNGEVAYTPALLGSYFLLGDSSFPAFTHMPYQKATWYLDPAGWDDDPSACEIWLAKAGGSANPRIFKAALELRYVAKPVVDVLDPSGTVTDTNTPTVEWELTSADADADYGAEAYEVKLFNSAQYSAGGFAPGSSTPFDSWTGSVGGGSPYGDSFNEPVTSWTSDLVLPDDDYKAYVRLAKFADGRPVWSDWASSDFAVDFTSPAEPGVVLTPQSAQGRVQIAISSGGGTPTSDSFQVQRSDDGGETFATIRYPDDTEPPAGTIYDYEAPQDTELVYRVRAQHGNAEGFSGWVEETVEWGAGEWWLKHPFDPALSMKVTIQSYAGHDRPARQGVLQALNSGTAVALSDTRSAPAGSITLLADTSEEEANLDSLLEAGDALLLHGPVSDHEPPRWLALGDLNRTRLVDKAWVEGSANALGWVEVERPSGGLV